MNGGSYPAWWGCKWRQRLLALVLALPWVGAGAAEFSLGVVPQFPARRMFTIWQPVVEELERRTGDRFVLIVPASISDFEKDLEAGKFDFVYGNPYHIARKLGPGGYVPLIRDQNPIRGLLVVLANSPLRTPADLEGKTLAVPSPNAIGASLLLRADLEDQFHVRVNLLDVRTHSAVYRNVAAGLADAGGGVSKTLEEQDEDLRQKLRTIYLTREIPAHPIAAHARVPEAKRESLRRAFMAIAKDASARTLLAEIPMSNPAPAGMAEYAKLKSWRLERFWSPVGH